MTTNPTCLTPFQSFGLSESPFHISPDLRYYLATEASQAAFAELCYGIQMRKGLLVLTGEPGAGKTLLLRRLLQWLQTNNQSSSHVFHCHLDSEDLFRTILQGFGIVPTGQSKTDLLRALAAWLEQRAAVGDSPAVIVDEAQGLSVRALDALRLLLNLENANGKLLQIVLAGQPELDEKLRRPQLLPLRQRISVRARLPLFSLEQCADYVQMRLVAAGTKEQGIFPPETIRAIHAYSGGIPRVMNLLCENALLSAYAAGQASVSVEMVRAVAADFNLETTNLTCKYSAVPIRAEALAKAALECAAELRPLPQPTRSTLAAPMLDNARHLLADRVADVPTRRATHPLTVTERPVTGLKPTQLQLRESGPAALVWLKTYCRAVLHSFLADWGRLFTAGGRFKSKSSYRAAGPAPRRQRPLAQQTPDSSR